MLFVAKENSEAQKDLWVTRAKICINLSNGSDLNSFASLDANEAIELLEIRKFIKNSTHFFHSNTVRMKKRWAKKKPVDDRSTDEICTEKGTLC